jgi:hypothetical protein
VGTHGVRSLCDLTAVAEADHTMFPMGVDAKLFERTDKGLDRYVGYAEIEAALPVSRSTIERAWRGPHKEGEPRLPKPGKIKSRSVWPAVTVNRWARQLFERQLTELERLAQSDPENLAPKDIASATFDLAARHLLHETGEVIAPEDVLVGYQRPFSQAEKDAHFAEALRNFAHSSLAHYSLERSLLVAAHLFPALREAWKGKPGMPQTAEQALAWALIAGNDRAWEKIESEARGP